MTAEEEAQLEALLVKKAQETTPEIAPVFQLIPGGQEVNLLDVAKREIAAASRSSLAVVYTTDMKVHIRVADPKGDMAALSSLIAPLRHTIRIIESQLWKSK